MRSKPFRTAIATTLLLVSLFTAMQTFSIANAQYEGIEYHGRPLISIHSPMQNIITSSTDVALSLTIEKPQTMWISSLTSNDTSHFNKLANVTIVIDGKVYNSIKVDSDLSAPYHYSTVITGLTKGTHILTIKAECEGWALWYQREFYNHKETYETSKEISFSVISATELATAQPTAQPTQGTIPPTSTPLGTTTQNTTPTLTPVGTFTTESLLLIIFIALIVIVFLLAVIVFLLFYFKKQRAT